MSEVTDPGDRSTRAVEPGAGAGARTEPGGSGATVPAQPFVTSNDRNERLFLLTVLAIAGIAYLWLFSLVSDGVFAPAWSDEYHYVANTRMFLETGRLGAAYMLGESISRIGGFDAHGFAYPLFHGIISRIFGIHTLTPILTNLVLLLLALAVILRQRIDRSMKLGMTGAVLLYFLVPIYLFTYVQETMQIPFAVAAGFLLYRVFREPDPGRRRRYIAGYLAVLILASVFRPSWMMFTVALIPLAQRPRQVVYYSLLSVGAILAGYFYTFFFFAPFNYGVFAKAMVALRTAGVADAAGMLFNNLTTNIRDYFAKIMPVYWDIPGQSTYPATVASQVAISYFLSKYLLVLVTGVCLWYGYYRKNRFALGIGIAALVNFFFIFAFYDASVWREHRTMAPIFFMGLIVLMADRRWRTVVLTLLLVLFPQVLNYTSNVIIRERRRVAMEYRAQPEIVKRFEQIRYDIPDRRVTTVLLSRDLYDAGDIPGMRAGPNLLALPVTNEAGYPIRWTANMLGKDLAVFKPGFVDYVLYPDYYTDSITGRTSFSLILDTVSLARPARERVTRP